MSELKLCPFCGGTADLCFQDRSGNALKAFNGRVWKVICKNPGCYLKDILDFGHDTKEFAIKAWNTRHSPEVDSLKETARELLEALKSFKALIDNCIEDKQADKLITRHYCYTGVEIAITKASKELSQ